MIWDDLFETMLKQIAKDLGFGFSKTRAGYLLTKESTLIGFSTFVSRECKLKILVSPRASGRPIDLSELVKQFLNPAFLPALSVCS